MNHALVSLLLPSMAFFNEWVISTKSLRSSALVTHYDPIEALFLDVYVVVIIMR